ncbi:RNA polymerase sigma factor [Phaeacidiphilus oryzae]|uniref:RNA polymerase sigma factor n=1 Tax=Phaeacidiphilus oryzae TaxID=348818 RepID=UPI00068ACD3F|nr:RNA polymerase sigma factor [Phaeacidiphilus oryzae]
MADSAAAAATRRRAAELEAAVQGARTGDEDDFRALYRELGPRLLNYVRSIVGEADAEDVAAETWAAIARGLPRFTGDADGFRGWTTTIARNRARDHLRRRRPVLPMPNEELPVATAVDDTAVEAVDALSTAVALRLIAGLPPDQAQAVLLQVVVGLDSPSAATLLDKKADNVRAATRRGLRSLARRLHLDVAPSSNPVPRKAR